MTMYEEIVVRRTISPAARTNGTVNGTAVDRAAHGGCRGTLFVIQTGTITDGSHAAAVEDSDDGSTGWANISAGNLQGTPPTIVGADDDKLFVVGVLSSKRFIRVTVVTSGATTGGLFGANVVLGDTVFDPVTQVAT